MSEKNFDFGKFREARLAEPDDISLLRFIFKKYLKDKKAMNKLLAEAEKEEQDDMALMLAESLKASETDLEMRKDLEIFVFRNNMLENVMRWLGLAKEKLIEEYNLQASVLGIKGQFKKSEEDLSGKTALKPAAKKNGFKN